MKIWYFKISSTGPHSSMELRWLYNDDIDGLVQACSISIALAMEILQSYTELLIYNVPGS